MASRVRAAALVAVLSGGLGVVRNHAQTAAPPPQATVGTGAISGVVVDGVSGKPVAGAVVTLTGPRVPGDGPVAVRNLVLEGTAGSYTINLLGRTVITDELGRFVFAALPAFETYTLGASMNGYFGSSFGANAPAAGRTKTPRIALADGQWLSDVRINLWPPSSVAGRVLDEAGEPVVNVIVRVVQQVLVAGRFVLAPGPMTRTDDRGFYRLSRLEPGRYLVVVLNVQASVPSSAATPDLLTFERDAGNKLVLNRYATPPPTTDGHLQAYPITFFPSAQSPADAVTVELARGQRAQGVDIRLIPVPSVTVTGYVDAPPAAASLLDSLTGAGPLAGMTLRLMVAGAEDLGFGHEAATALIAANGSFTFLNVPSGRYTLIASRTTAQLVSGNETMAAIPSPAGPRTQGGGSVTLSVPSTSGTVNFWSWTTGGPSGFSGRASVIVGDADVRDVVVALRPPATISGAFAWDGPPPAPVSSSDSMSINAEPAFGDPTLGVQQLQHVSRAPGTTFAMSGLPAGEYVLKFGSLMVKSIATPVADYTHRPFDVSDGRDISDVLVTFTTKGAHIEAVVRGDRAAASPAAVIAFPVDATRWTGYGLTSPEIVSDLNATNGKWSSTLPAGDYFVIAVDASLVNAWSDPKFLEAAAGMATRVAVGWGETKAVDLTVKPVKWR